MPAPKKDDLWEVSVTVVDSVRHTRDVRTFDATAPDSDAARRKVRYMLESNPYLTVVGQGTARRKAQPKPCENCGRMVFDNEHFIPSTAFYDQYYTCGELGV